MTDVNLEGLTREEGFWKYDLGDLCAEHNDRATEAQARWWGAVASRYQFATVLEVGCGPGANLTLLRQSGVRVFGVDCNARALGRAQAHGHPVAQAFARALPFQTASVDLVFTMGLLIHVPPRDRASVLREVRRVARRFVALVETYSPIDTVTDMHGLRDVWWSSDFHACYRQVDPDAILIAYAFLGDPLLHAYLYRVGS